MQKIIYHVEGLDCKEECSILEHTLKNQKGIERLDFDLLSQELTVTYHSDLIDSGKILELIASTGMKAYSKKDNDFSSPKSFWQVNNRLILCILSGIFLLTAFILHIRFGHFTFDDRNGLKLFQRSIPWVVLLFYLSSLLSSLWFVTRKAYLSAKQLRPDMNLLMFIAVLGALCIGQWFEAASVSFLFSLSLLLESWSVNRARKAIHQLLELSPPLAKVITNSGALVEKKVEDVFKGERILVRPKEKIPLDGSIVKGASAINEAPLTGESMPVFKKEGDLVYAGCQNEDGFLEIVTLKEAEDTALARIIQLVKDTQNKKATVQQWVDRFAQVYTPIMFVLALCVAILPPLFMGMHWMPWIYRGLVFLVIACPCALVISTPVTLLSGLTASLRRGVLIKGGIFLEIAAHLKAICFDKTGTLTSGEPAVQSITTFNGHTERELLEIAAALESYSDHPLARALTAAAASQNIRPQKVDHLKAFHGLGIEGTLQGKPFWIGSHRFMHEEQRKESPEAHKRAEELEDAGHTVIAIGDFKHICGLISISDAPRPLLFETLASLKALGIEHIVLLTGDNKATAEAIGKSSGVDAIFSELLPEDKLQLVKTLKKKYKSLAMVGDGINDTPAMAESSLGIAMGKIGTDAAFEVADIVLMQDDLNQLPSLIRHARYTLATVKQNVAFALGVKAVFILLATFGVASLWMAIGADIGASLLVIFNGLKLLKHSP